MVCGKVSGGHGRFALRGTDLIRLGYKLATSQILWASEDPYTATEIGGGSRCEMGFVMGNCYTLNLIIGSDSERVAR